MKLLFDADPVDAPPGVRAADALVALRAFRCQCGRPIFFRNSVCLACKTPLGYEPHATRLLPLAPGPMQNTWVPHPGADAEDVAALRTSTPLYAYCANLGAAACNWLVDVEPDGAVVKPLCVACRLNRTIPDLAVGENQMLWRRIEVAKRRLVSSLVGLGLPVRSKVGEDPKQGVAFDFLSPDASGTPVLTGHDDGLITLNLDEADDAKREAIRHKMHEPYRTLLGHLRHEIGHYYWDRLIAGTRWHEPCRTVFGDESTDYAEALKAHYEKGARPDWPQHFVSAYASSHPWEDWAETWAHYLHMIDTLDTAFSFGLNAENFDIEYEPFTSEELFELEDPGGEAFLAFVNGWIRLTGALNELSRSMGEPDFYPFVLSRDAVRKLHFVHVVVKHSRTPSPPQHAGPAEAADAPTGGEALEVPEEATAEATIELPSGGKPP